MTKEKCYNYPRKKYEELTFLDDFLFCKLMRNPEICKGILETILGIEIERIDYPQTQKTIDILADAKSIRLDVYVKGDDTVYNVEMQATNTGELPKRSRYYQGLIDMDLIEKGESYNNLNKSYVIFICDFDPFGYGIPIYKFMNRCEELSLPLGDETYKVFVNLRGVTEKLNKGQKALFDYLNTKNISDQFTALLDDFYLSSRENLEWRREFMTLDMKIREECNKALALGREEGRMEGREEGRMKGREEGMNEKTFEIFSNLMKNGFKLEKAKELVGITDEQAADYFDLFVRSEKRDI